MFRRPERSLYYDRAGNAIGLLRWVYLRERPNYFRVAQTTVGKYWISTVWLGLDHGFGRGKPLIFETMITHNGEFMEYQVRYVTEAHAFAGHRAAVAYAKQEHNAEGVLTQFGAVIATAIVEAGLK